MKLQLDDGTYDIGQPNLAAAKMLEIASTETNSPIESMIAVELLREGLDRVLRDIATQRSGDAEAYDKGREKMWQLAKRAAQRLRADMDS